MRDISIRKPDAKKPSLGLTALDVSGAAMSLKNKTVTVADVTITGPFAKVVMGKDGQLDLGKLLIKEEEILSKTEVVETVEKPGPEDGMQNSDAFLLKMVLPIF